ncbi:MAG: hypothetical protein VX184_00305 [Candidatus Thermoplasmatota archaeon]|nr:hypothetical protein [Candidatus Thermoplasmatota archaeon]MEC9001458.1 hypothetical protein [Candidatus Thermoplasmatota archaeon]MEE3315271.1 hypothetical protein [Candidatus Thermoplasmatota archaeon]
MGEVVTSMAFFWGLMLLSYFLMQNGMWILNDVIKSMCRFALGKALGPAIDFVEGREGSASKTWMMQGMFWLILASLFTFEGLWLAYDPHALHSLSSWGYNPTSESLLYAAGFATMYGGVGMLIVASSFHIIPKLADTKLASERNGTLVSYLWTLSVLFAVIAAHDSVILGINIFLIATGLHGLAFLAVLINLLLTASERKSPLPLPGWLIMLGMLADPISVVASVLGGIGSGSVQWLLGHLVTGTFFFATLAGISLYVSSSATGNPLWSRSLTAVTTVGVIATLTPMGYTDGRMAADLLLTTVEDVSMQTTDGIVVAFLMALAIVPVITLVANVMMTLRGGDAFVENPDSAGVPEINLGVSMLLPLAVASLFVQSDALSHSPELVGISSTLVLMVGWLVMVPLSLGAAQHLFPSVTGRNLLSANRSRWAFWMMGWGAFFGLAITMMADIAQIEATADSTGIMSGEVRVVGAILFYGTSIGAIMHTLNALSGLYRGTPVSEARATSTSIARDDYSLTTPTSVRRILAGGAHLDTTVVPVGESDEPGAPTDLH